MQYPAEAYKSIVDFLEVQYYRSTLSIGTKLQKFVISLSLLHTHGLYHIEDGLEVIFGVSQSF